MTHHWECFCSTHHRIHNQVDILKHQNLLVRSKYWFRHNSNFFAFEIVQIILQAMMQESMPAAMQEPMQAPMQAMIQAMKQTMKQAMISAAMQAML